MSDSRLVAALLDRRTVQGLNSGTQRKVLVPTGSLRSSGYSILPREGRGVLGRARAVSCTNSDGAPGHSCTRALGRVVGGREKDKTLPRDGVPSHLSTRSTGTGLPYGSDHGSGSSPTEPGVVQGIRGVLSLKGVRTGGKVSIAPLKSHVCEGFKTSAYVQDRRGYLRGH